jgi:hypothetical protein
MARLTAEALMAPGGLLDAGSRLVQTIMEVPLQRAQFEEQTDLRKRAEQTRQQERYEDVKRQQDQLTWEQTHRQDQMKLGLLQQEMAARVDMMKQEADAIKAAQTGRLSALKAFQTAAGDFTDADKEGYNQFNALVDTRRGIAEKTIKAQMGNQEGLTPEMDRKIREESASAIFGDRAGEMLAKFSSMGGGDSGANPFALDWKALNANALSIDPDRMDALKQHYDVYTKLANQAHDIAGIERANMAFDDMLTRIGLEKPAAAQEAPVQEQKPALVPPGEEPAPTKQDPNEKYAEELKRDQADAEQKRQQRAEMAIAGGKETAQATGMRNMELFVPSLDDLSGTLKRFGSGTENLAQLIDRTDKVYRTVPSGVFGESTRNTAFEALKKAKQIVNTAQSYSDAMTRSTAISLGVPPSNADAFVKQIGEKYGNTMLDAYTVGQEAAARVAGSMHSVVRGRSENQKKIQQAAATAREDFIRARIGEIADEASVFRAVSNLRQTFPAPQPATLTAEGL